MQSELEKNISKELDYGEYFCWFTILFISLANMWPDNQRTSDVSFSFCTCFSLLATAELEGSSARMSPVGSACGSQKNLNLNLNLEQQDQLSKATQQYLEVLKKNYMI